MSASPSSSPIPDLRDVSCSVVVYGTPAAALTPILDSVSASGLRGRAWMVDNALSPALAGLAQRRSMAYVHLPHNPGYGTAHNVAIAAALAAGMQYHVVMNPDIRFSRDVLPAMRNFMDRHADIGLLAPRVLYPDGRLQHLCKLLPHPADLLVRRFCPPLHRLSGQQARYEMHDSGYDQVMDVPAVSGCFMMLRLATIRQVGAFDPRYFMYFEDVDLSRRIGSVARTVYFPRATIFHDYAKASYRSAHLMRCHVVSAVRYFNKWGWWQDAWRDAVNRAVRRQPMLPA